MKISFMRSLWWLGVTTTNVKIKAQSLPSRLKTPNWPWDTADTNPIFQYHGVIIIIIFVVVIIIIIIIIIIVIIIIIIII